MLPAPSLLLLVMALQPAVAQATPQRLVTGLVYDSVAKTALSGAVVQLVLADSATRTYSATTDAFGHYRIGPLPAGRYGIGFQHPSLVALGLDPPVRAFQLFADSALRVDLAIPSGPAVRAMQCADSSRNAVDGLLAGFVLDASRGSTVAGAVVELSWVEIASVRGRLQTVTRRVEAIAGEDGAYVACGLIGGTPVNLTIVRPGYRDISAELTVPPGTTTRRDFRLADTALASGRGVISGRALHADGSRVANGHVVIPALGVEARIEDGTYSIPGVPAGTWLVQARVIGYEPVPLLADVSDGAPANVPIALGPRVQRLEAVSIVGKASPDMKILNDIVERSRASWGTQFMPGNSWLATATFPADPLRAARGFVYTDMDNVYSRSCVQLGSLEMSTVKVTPKQLIVYLDGQRIMGSNPLGIIREMVPMKDVLAIEAYPDFMSIPAMWRTADACAVIAIWTKH